MPKIKWIGVIDQEDIKKYQTAPLPDNAVKTDLPNSMGEMMLKAAPFAIGSFMICMISMVMKCSAAKMNVISMPWTFAGLLIAPVYLILHEFLHAIVYPRKATVSIGILKQFAAVALAFYPLKKVRFALMSLLPYLLGLVPLILFQLVPAENEALNSILFILSMIGMISPYPDAYNVCYMIRKIPAGSKIVFCGDDTYYIPKEG
ncbi:MAG: DUF3267 domain-containing protein [Ruminococcus sp.]|uniref:DUF3267 domain-containing protein n=1 Tax=Ruminococcus sp. TaxID=41978 RepID=UPI0025DCFCFB|nr:DUF3267 domain-containing protein [Ruminococcus sp.]MBO4865888.1 DUF3267 domain-containing protein [Ruminococcus sp.]